MVQRCWCVGAWGTSAATSAGDADDAARDEAPGERPHFGAVVRSLLAMKRVRRRCCSGGRCRSLRSVVCLSSRCISQSTDADHQFRCARLALVVCGLIARAAVSTSGSESRRPTVARRSIAIGTRCKLSGASVCVLPATKKSSRCAEKGRCRKGVEVSLKLGVEELLLAARHTTTRD